MKSSIIINSLVSFLIISLGNFTAQAQNNTFNYSLGEKLFKGSYTFSFLSGTDQSEFSKNPKISIQDFIDANKPQLKFVLKVDFSFSNNPHFVYNFEDQSKARNFKFLDKLVLGKENNVIKLIYEFEKFIAGKDEILIKLYVSSNSDTIKSQPITIPIEIILEDKPQEIIEGKDLIDKETDKKPSKLTESNSLPNKLITSSPTRPNSENNPKVQEKVESQVPEKETMDNGSGINLNEGKDSTNETSQAKSGLSSKRKFLKNTDKREKMAEIPYPKNESSSNRKIFDNYIFWVALSLLIVLVLYFIHNYLKSKPGNYNQINGPSLINSRKHKIAIKEHQYQNELEKPLSELPPMKYEENLSSDIGLRQRGFKENSKQIFGKEVKYFTFHLNEFWENSSISKVYISLNCANELNEFLNNPHFDLNFEEEIGKIPEIGGFVLGRYSLDLETNSFLTTLEKFVPISAQEQNAFKIEFGRDALIHLSNIQDQFSEYETLAWFHTHPGHGLFLSQADLKIHQGFFTKRYQMAIEIDSVKDNFPFAIFTRTKEGAVNNDRDLKKGATWTLWNNVITNLRAIENEY